MTDKKKATAIKLMNSVQMEAAIKSIAGRGAKLQADIHACAVSALDHFQRHGDSTLMNRLVLALPKSSRTNALIAWALHFGQFALNDDKATRGAQPLVKSPIAKPLDLAACMEQPFWSFKATEGVSVFSFDTYTASLVKSLTHAIGKTTDEAHKAKLTAALAAVQGPVSPVPAVTDGTTDAVAAALKVPALV